MFTRALGMTLPGRALTPDFAGTLAPTISDLVADPPPKEQTRLTRLTDAPVSDARNALIGEWIRILQRVDRGLVARRRQVRVDALLSEAQSRLSDPKSTASAALLDRLRELMPLVAGIVDEPKDQVKRPSGEFLTEELLTSVAEIGDDQLTADCGQVLAKVDAFLAESLRQRIEALETLRRERWTACRAAEDALKSAVSAFGESQNVVHAQEQVVGAWNQKLSEVNRPDTEFPTDVEIAEYNSRRAGVERELSINEERLADARGWSETRRLEAQRCYRDRSERKAELAAVERELESLKKS